MKDELLKAAQRLLDGISNGKSNLVMECADLRNAIEGAKPCGVPDSALCLFKDGTAWVATCRDFIDLQESPAGFGSTWEEAVTSLQSAVEKQLAKANSRR